MVRRKWYEGEGLRFTCTQCGNCCSGPPGHVWVNQREIEAIAAFLGREDGKLDGQYVRRVGVRHSLTERTNGDCVFLQRRGDQRVCSIYPVRPLQCRTWPFWSSNLRSSQAWADAAANCPGMNNGRHYGFVAVEELRLKKSW